MALMSGIGDKKYHVDCRMHSPEPERAHWQLYQCILINFCNQTIFEGVRAFQCTCTYVHSCKLVERDMMLVEISVTFDKIR